VKKTCSVVSACVCVCLCVCCVCVFTEESLGIILSPKSIERRKVDHRNPFVLT